MRLTATILTLFTLLILSGCATMNRSECLNADWQIIGLEDGSKGRAIAYIGEHREACAEYGITPNLENYQHGYRQGLTQYCTYSNGFRIGQRGSAFNSICPPERNEAFQLGYQRGREIHALSRAIKNTQASIDEASGQLEELHGKLQHKESLLIQAKTSKADRVLLLKDIIDLRVNIDHLEEDLDMLDAELGALTSERNTLRQKYLASSL